MCSLSRLVEDDAGRAGDGDARLVTHGDNGA